MLTGKLCHGQDNVDSDQLSKLFNYDQERASIALRHPRVCCLLTGASYARS